MIVVYKTRRGRAHAEYVQDFGDIAHLDYHIIAIIELPS